MLDQHLLGEDSGMWECVDDFGWIKALQSPNWSRMPEDQRQTLPEVPGNV